MPKLDTTERLRILNTLMQESQGHTMYQLAEKIQPKNNNSLKKLEL